MSNTGYWTDENWEYTFLVPQDTIDGNYKRKIHTVLKEFNKTLYVRSDSDSSGWEEMSKTMTMPELETSEEKEGWTLSSANDVLSDKGVLGRLKENLKKAGCVCSFMVIKDEPEKDTEENSEVNLEAEDSEKPTLDEPSQQTEKVEKKSGKEKKKKKQKSKKSNKVQVGQGIQTRTINSLKDRKKSQEASEKHGLTTYKVVSKPNNGKHNIKSAWNKIGDFIKTHADTYKDVKPVGYGDKKHWHSWHKSWVEKVFVQGDQARFWLMKLNDGLKDKLETDLKKLGFTIEPYEDGNSKSVTPTISTEPGPENPEVEPMKKPEETPKPPDAHKTSEGTQKPPVRPLPKTPNKEKEVTAASQQISENIDRDEKKPLPETSKPSTSPSFLGNIRTGTKLKKTPKVTRQEINENSENDITSMLRNAMMVRRADIADDEEPVEGDKNHEIMKILQSKGNGIYIAKLQLTSPYKEVKELLSAKALCPGGAGKMWLTNNEKGQHNTSSDIRGKIDEQTLEKCAITKDNEPVEWYVKVLTEIESDKWEDEDDDKDFLPSVTQMEALQAMRKDVTNKGARLVSISTPLPELKALVKNPPTLPKRNMKAGPVPSGFATLDSFKPKPNNRNVKTLVLVNYDNIRNSKELMMDLRYKLKKSTRKYDAFDVDKATRALSAFENGTLIGARGMKDAKNYRTVLANPVFDNYKANAGSYVVALWNLDIPEDTPDADIAKLRDELAKCGIAIRKDWRKGKV